MTSPWVEMASEWEVFLQLYMESSDPSGISMGLCFWHNFSGMKRTCWTTGSWRCCLSLEGVSSILAGFTIIYRFLCGFISVSLCQSIKITPTNMEYSYGIIRTSNSSLLLYYFGQWGVTANMVSIVCWCHHLRDRPVLIFGDDSTAVDFECSCNALWTHVTVGNHCRVSNVTDSLLAQP